MRGGFVIAAVGTGHCSSWALPLTSTLAAFSMGLGVLGLPETVAGILVNAAILSGAAWVARARARTPETEVL